MKILPVHVPMGSFYFISPKLRNKTFIIVIITDI